MIIFVQKGLFSHQPVSKMYMYFPSPKLPTIILSSVHKNMTYKNKEHYLLLINKDYNDFITALLACFWDCLPLIWLHDIHYGQVYKNLHSVRSLCLEHLWTCSSLAKASTFLENVYFPLMLIHNILHIICNLYICFSFFLLISIS